MKSMVEVVQNLLKPYIDSQIQTLTNDVSTNATAIQATRNSIAPTEDGTNYSTSYTKGEQFYRNGVLYTVTASSVNSSTAINTGSGGNATAVNNITEQIRGLIKVTSDGNERRSESDAPSTYPIGVTMTGTGTGSDWPHTYGIILTFKIIANYGVQMSFNSTGSAMEIRLIDSPSTWTSWHSVTMQS